MEKAILYDSTKCIACRGCQVACKRWNDLEAVGTSLTQEWTNPPDLSPQTYNYIRFVGKGTGFDFGWHFATVRCMHCLQPACASVCPVKAITKYPEGPVVVDQNKCIGCQYCVAACPFGIMRYDPVENKVFKCTLCADRLREGLQPACTQACPTEALKFGNREDLIREAEVRRVEIGSHMYGNEEAGGTSVIVVSKIAPTELGYPSVTKDIPLHVTLRNYLKPLAGVASLLAVGMSAVIALAQFRMRRSKEV